MDEADKRVESLHKEFKNDLQELHTDIKFIKENLFNPEDMDYGQKPNKTHNLENLLLCGEV